MRHSARVGSLFPQSIAGVTVAVAADIVLGAHRTGTWRNFERAAGDTKAKVLMRKASTTSEGRAGIIFAYA
ncbi:hypothetical protein LMTR3_25310 [Bradyrhizobium sp. LMTR 3]|nr:hypothetical protein LMTR3_25310 [Bradyrhizobium sp. LMTR 3]